MFKAYVIQIPRCFQAISEQHFFSWMTSWSSFVSTIFPPIKKSSLIILRLFLSCFYVMTELKSRILQLLINYRKLENVKMKIHEFWRAINSFEWIRKHHKLAHAFMVSFVPAFGPSSDHFFASRWASGGLQAVFRRPSSCLEKDSSNCRRSRFRFSEFEDLN